MRISILIKCLILLYLLGFLANCSSRKSLLHLESKEGQAIVTGKIYVFYNGADVTEKTSVLFNEVNWGKYNYRADSSHILLTHLPLGECYIARLAYQTFRYNIPKEKSLVTLNNSDSIYYLGDITLDWKGAKDKVPGAMFGLVGVLADEANPDGTVDIYVESNPDSITKYLLNKYDNQKPLKSNIIQASQLTATIKENILKNIRTDLYQFNLKDNQIIQGKLFRKTDNELYIKDKKIVYIVKKDKLLSITKNGQDVTEDALNNFEEMDISLFKYTVKRID